MKEFKEFINLFDKDIIVYISERNNSSKQCFDLIYKSYSKNKIIFNGDTVEQLDFFLWNQRNTLIKIENDIFEIFNNNFFKHFEYLKQFKNNNNLSFLIHTYHQFKNQSFRDVAFSGQIAHSASVIFSYEKDTLRVIKSRKNLAGIEYKNILRKYKIQTLNQI